MFAAMTGAPPQPADQRRQQDKMDVHFEKLAGAYSSELLAMVRSCLALDPLARPQSVFSVQKALQAGATGAPQPATPAPAAGWRGLAERIGLLNRGKAGRSHS
jgi:hypothetical protein